MHFERNSKDQLISHPTQIFNSVTEGLNYIGLNHKETKKLEKHLSVYIQDTTKICIHSFKMPPTLFFLSIETENENEIPNVLNKLELKLQDCIKKSFDELT